MAQAQPIVLRIRLARIGQVGLGAVADVEQVAEHLHGVALLALAEQRRHRNAQVLALQVQQRGLHRGHRMDGGAQVESLLPAAAGVTVGELRAHGIQDRLQVAYGLAFDQCARVFQRLPDLLAARHLAQSGVAGAVGGDDDVAREEGRVRAGKIEQHAVPAGNRDHSHLPDDWCAHGINPL